MWPARLRRNEESTYAQASRFMACWDVMASVGGDLGFRLRDRILSRHALNEVLERAVRCAAGDGTRIVFDLSGAEEMESCYSVICALFIRFARRAGQRCRITGPHPRMADVMAFYLRRINCIELEPARQPTVAAS